MASRGKMRSDPAAQVLPAVAPDTAMLPRAAVYREPTTLWGQTLRDIRKSNKWGYIFIAPLMIDFLIFTVYMIVRAVLMGFQEIGFGGVATKLGLANFRYALQVDPLFWNAVKNTVYYTGAVVPGTIIVALILSELIFRRNTRVQVFFKSAYYLPGVVSSVVMAIVWIWVFQPFYGLLNWVIGLVGLGPYSWLGDPKLAMPSLILMAILGGIGAPVVLITAAMGGIPNDLYDAAKIDGAGDWTRFWRVTVPLLRPTLLYLFVTGFIGYFQVFDQIYVMTQGGPGYPPATQTMGFLIYQSAFEKLQLGRAAAQSILLFFGILVFSVIQFRLFAAELEY